MSKNDHNKCSHLTLAETNNVRTILTCRQTITTLTLGQTKWAQLMSMIEYAGNHMKNHYIRHNSKSINMLYKANIGVYL